MSLSDLISIWLSETNRKHWQVIPTGGDPQFKMNNGCGYNINIYDDYVDLALVCLYYEFPHDLYAHDTNFFGILNRALNYIDAREIHSFRIDENTFYQLEY